ncbi:uncharacterized protein LOC143231481 [Tachypleus tridentatus]|uniref:uncharacterized protein LOC143231481 n=1 Tax=Tachypleus tridentatus TaxID=6853 RepID=UPI003FD40B85
MCHGACPSQRCYWRTLKKRSADILKPKPTTLPVLESISLFQALEVQQEKSRVGSRDRENKGGYKDGRVICLQKIGFAALLSGLMFAFMLTSGLTIFLCLRLRRVKNSIEKQPIKMKDPCLHRLQKLDK